MTKVRCSLLILVLLPAISIAKEQVRDATICEINSHEREYAGKMVRVRGRLVQGMETLFIIVDDCGLDIVYPNGPAELGPMATYQPYAEPRMPVKFKLLRDESYEKLVRFAQEVLPQKPECGICLGCYRYEVTVTMTGLIQVAKPGKPGFSHMNAARSRLVINSVSEVQAVDISSRYKDLSCAFPQLTLPANPYPAWNQPLNVPPFPSSNSY